MDPELPRPTLHLEPVAGTEMGAHREAVARLRIEVFREWPYLYEGTLAYERRYLDTYARNPRSIVILARADTIDGPVVGAATAVPLADEEPEFREPFRAAGIDDATFLYAGESILRAAYRGHGVGRRFFALREAHARRLGLRAVTFAAVERSDDDPRRPAGYRPLDSFWTSLGYVRRPDLRTSFRWREVGSKVETAQSMVFWVKDLG